MSLITNIKQNDGDLTNPLASPKITYAGNVFVPNNEPTFTVESTSVDDITGDHPIEIYSTHLYWSVFTP